MPKRIVSSLILASTLLTSFAPAPAPAAVATADKDEVQKLAKDLKSRDPKTRLKAAEALGAIGSDASDAAKELCDAILDPNAGVSKAAFLALETVRPDLYKPIAKIVLDANSAERAEGVAELGALEADATPAAHFLSSVLLKMAGEDGTGGPRIAMELGGRPGGPAAALPGGPGALPGRPGGPGGPGVGLGAAAIDSTVQSTAYAALARIKPTDPAVLKHLRTLAGATTKSPGHRYLALQCLIALADDDEAKRKELVPFIKAGLDPKGPAHTSLLYIALANDFGALAKDCLPVLKKLKLSPTTVVRDAATKAVEDIESEVPEGGNEKRPGAVKPKGAVSDK